MEIRFGTDGWRGVIDEDFTEANVRLVARAVAEYLHNAKPDGHGVLIGYDNRFKSEVFARVAAEELARCGLPAVLSESSLSSPALSYAVYHRRAQGGVMITASHNPPQFNGFKFKAHYGGSALPEITEQIETHLQRILAGEPVVAHNPAELRIENLTAEYLQHLTTLVDMPRILDAGWKVVADAMHGSGAGYLRTLLQDGRTQVTAIRESRDTQFGGVNPEPIASNLALLMETVLCEGADIGIALDGDADRVGAVDEHGNFVDSHRIFAITLYHLVNRRGWRGRVIKTISTTNMIDALCRRFELPLTITPIGFKYICENMLQGDVLIGGEESGGIGIQHHIPERDGVLMGLMLLEAMTLSGKKLSELVQEIFQLVGEHHYDRIDLHLEREEMPAASERIAQTAAKEVAGMPVKAIDRMDGTKFLFEDGAWLLLRASGTEPVVRIYAEASTPEAVQELLSAGESLVRGR
ncbi:MAG: phosphoglucomutase/phosphomannomutase family protein [Armatimonadota bacterium]|nr:phosphoglucomutase/phosphomannomutase family protein [bacterium]MDW8319876.1 phosphoglucomutase/phosphomannomutase family protein [Armatimonadota bacterium]